MHEKFKRTYCPDAITPIERRLLKRHSWVRNLWFSTGKPIYRFVTRKLLKWEDNEGQGPRPYGAAFGAPSKRSDVVSAC